MSLTGNTDRSPRGESSTIPTWSAWLTVPLTLLYGAAIFTAEGSGDSTVVSIVGSAALLVLGTVLFVLLPSLAADYARFRRVVRVEGVMLTLLLIAGAIWQPSSFRPLIGLVLPAAVLGLSVQRGATESRAFWWSLGLVALIQIGFYLPSWPKQVQMIREAAPYIAGDIVGKVQAYGIAVSDSETMITTWTRNIRVAGWLLPGVMTMSSLIPFALGSLWFLTRRANQAARPTAVQRFTEWSLGRSWLMPVVIAGGLHFGEWEAVRLIGDNVLFALAIVFAIVGTAALEALLRTLKIPAWGRVVAYVIIAVAHLYGLLLLIAAGVIDTILGVRRRPKAVAAGKE